MSKINLRWTFLNTELFPEALYKLNSHIQLSFRTQNAKQNLHRLSLVYPQKIKRKGQTD